MITRRKARETAYKLIFEYLFSGKINNITYQIMISSDLIQSDADYIKQVYVGVHENYQELIDIVSEFSDTFVLDRIFKADLAALVLAVYEMKFMPDIPMSVSINEVVDIVKIYSTEKSYQYVNGILSSVFKKLTAKQDTTINLDATAIQDTTINLDATAIQDTNVNLNATAILEATI